jgi:hypothetical protein
MLINIKKIYYSILDFVLAIVEWEACSCDGDLNHSEDLYPDPACSDCIGTGYRPYNVYRPLKKTSQP